MGQWGLLAKSFVLPFWLWDAHDGWCLAGRCLVQLGRCRALMGAGGCREPVPAVLRAQWGLDHTQLPIPVGDPSEQRAKPSLDPAGRSLSPRARRAATSNPKIAPVKAGGREVGTGKNAVLRVSAV